MKYVAVNRDTATFQRQLDDQHLINLCHRAFGDGITPCRWQLITTGKFNTSYRIEFDQRATVVLRVAPPADAIIFQHEQLLLRREATVQQQLRTISDLVPQNLFTDFSRELIDRDYVFQPCLPGVLWESVKDQLSETENHALWQQFGSIVKKIHALPGTHFGQPSPGKNHTSWGDAMLSWVTEMVEDMQRYQLPREDAMHFLQLLEKHKPSLDEVTQASLVHGDLWLKNILIERSNGSANITAVLDAERAFLAEPAAEWIFSFFDLPAIFWQQYGTLPKGNSSQIRNRLYEGRGAIQLCLEAWRFNFDDAFARKILQQTIIALEGS
ncbi:MAG: phosphotransferase [Pseudomonadales bacterium]